MVGVRQIQGDGGHEPRIAPINVHMGPRGEGGKANRAAGGSTGTQQGQQGGCDTRVSPHGDSLPLPSPKIFQHLQVSPIKWLKIRRSLMMFCLI